METTEVPASVLTDLWTGTKLHGRQPPLCYGTSLGRGTANRTCDKVVKRSLHRAHRRALCLGHAWYKGRSYGLRTLHEWAVHHLALLLCCPLQRDCKMIGIDASLATLGRVGYIPGIGTAEVYQRGSWMKLKLGST